jgi:hypothetical protein
MGKPPPPTPDHVDHLVRVVADVRCGCAIARSLGIARHISAHGGFRNVRALDRRVSLSALPRGVREEVDSREPLLQLRHQCRNTSERRRCGERGFGKHSDVAVRIAVARRAQWRLPRGTLLVMPSVDRFADRLVAQTYEHDEPVRFDVGDPSTTVFVPERLFARVQGVARAYELHLLPAIDICGTTHLNRAQCETLLEEVAFVASISTDGLLHKHLARIQEAARICVLGHGELRIDGP